MKRNIEIMIVVGREQRGVMRGVSIVYKRMWQKEMRVEEGSKEEGKGNKGGIVTWRSLGSLGGLECAYLFR
jgi:hypothetical protein